MAANETVLIVDDRRENIAFLAESVLRPAGYDVTTAADGVEGVQRALREKPDLIITDLHVPRLNGLEILKALRQARSAIPVILMTFHGSEEAAVQAFQLGAKDYIIKPCTIQDMQRAIERALVEHRLRKERDRLVSDVTLANRRVERRLKELSVLASIGKSVTALLDENRLLTRVVDAAVYLTGAEEGLLLLADEESEELYMRAARGFGEKYARGFRLRVNDSLAGEVVRTGKPVIITGASREDRFKVKTGYLVKSLLHVPIKAGESVIGVLSVDHMTEDRSFTNHDLYLLSALADYAAISLENSRLQVKLQEQLERLSTGPLEPLQAETPEGAAEYGQDIQVYRQEIRAQLQEGSRILSDLSEKIASLEDWVEDAAARERPAMQRRSLAADTFPADGVPASLRQDLDTILDSIVDGVLVIGQDDQVVIVNRMAEELLGGPLTGRPVEGACDDPRWIKTYRIVKTAAQLQDNAPGSEISSATTPLTVANRMLSASFRIKAAVDQAPSGIVIVLRDVTSEREAQRAKDSFIASISQELRTPMTSILGYADLLMRGSLGPLTQFQGKFLDRIRANAERMGMQLNDLVGMTIIDSRQLEIKAETMDLVSTIHEAFDGVHKQMAEKGQALELDLEPNLPYVRADPDAMYHVLRNLLQNAHRCSPGKATIVLRARGMREGRDQYVLVSVTDAGGGIASEDHKKVFNRFYRSDNPTVSGLGDPEVSLPIVKTLVEAHGGRVWLESARGTGSTFTVILPIRQVAAPAPGSNAVPAG
ncbi:MAG: response regulator [Anaerolineae bacterium]|nr:response regulator [Anaerolineae bacterium]